MYCVLVLTMLSLEDRVCVCVGVGLVRGMGQAFGTPRSRSRGWEEDCEGYGSPEEAPDLALGRMQSEKDFWRR